jgi:ubiquinone/menaquinone biosynthesis C-methylase UbiE
LVQLTAKEISEKYNGFAPWYDVVEGVPDYLGVRKLRRSLLSRATGKVLEIAAGTGKNFAHYPKGCQLVAVDLSEGMLAVARQRAGQSSLTIRFAVMDAQALGFADECFDTVVSSLSTCTFPNPIGALREMARVCRRHGRILLLEHGRSDREWLGRWQDRHVDRFAKSLGCHWNREPAKMIRDAGLSNVNGRRTFFGIFHVIEIQL